MCKEILQSGVDVASLHGTFTDIFVVQSWPANVPGASSQLFTEEEDPAILNSVDIHYQASIETGLKTCWECVLGTCSTFTFNEQTSTQKTRQEAMPL